MPLAVLPRRLCIAAILVLVLGVGGWLAFIDRFLADSRTLLVNAPATGDVVVIGIDAASLEELDQWPWPRRYHAELIDRLLDAGVARIGLDIDFSSRSGADDDAALTAAIARAGPERIALPVFRQHQPTAHGAAAIHETGPKPAFAAGASLVGANVFPDADGIVRHLEPAQPWRGKLRPALATWLVGAPPSPADKPLRIDYAIDVETLPYLTYAEVMAGRFHPSLLAGRHVLVGAIDPSLGDFIAVPRYQVLPGVVFHALAAEVLLQDRGLEAFGGWPAALAAALLLIAAYPRLERLTSVAAVVALAAALLVIVTLPTVLQPAFGIVVDTVPFLLAWLAAALMVADTHRRRLVRLRREAAARAAQRQALFGGVVANSFDAILTLEAGDERSGRILSFNKTAETLFDWPAAAAIGAPLGLLLPESASAIIAAARRDGIERRELVVTHKDGRRLVADVAISRLECDALGLIGILTARDVTEQRAQAAMLSHLAMHDPLTGLPNRRHFRACVEQSLQRADHDRETIACMLVDLDLFKEINDTLGHSTGDRLLEEIAPRLRQIAGAQNMVARLGGDEFGLLLMAPISRQASIDIARAIVDALGRPFPMNGQTLEISASVGVTFFPEQANDTETLLRHADVAMYQAKRLRTGVAIYDPQEDIHTPRRLALRRDLRHAIGTEQLSLLYQPKVWLRGRRLAGVEALLRWQHPQLGTIAPSEFVPMAEELGIVNAITSQIIDAALQQSEAWRDSGHHIPIAINISALSIQDPAFIVDMLATIASVPDITQKLAFEITENALIVESDIALANLERIAKAGFELALDDFGTGYSSFAYLRELPIDTLKIDRAFLQAGVADPQSETVLRSIIDLANRLGLKTVAEGVEDARMLDRLTSFGCDLAQGYFLGHPGDATRITQWPAGTSFAGATPPLMPERSSSPPVDGSRDDQLRAMDALP